MESSSKKGSINQVNFQSDPAEQHRRVALDSFSIPASIHSPNGSISFVNRFWCTYTGIAFEEATASGAMAAIHSEDVPAFSAKWRAAMETGESFEVESRIRRADGVYRWFLILVSPFRDNSGNIASWHRTYIDVEDRKSAENALRRIENHLADVQELTHTGSWTWNVSLNENTYWSKETYRIFGFDPQTDSCSCENAMRRIHPDDAAKMRQIFEKSLQEKTRMEVYYRVHLPGESEKYVYSACHPVFNENGDLVEFSGTVTNVTEQHHMLAAMEATFSEVMQFKDPLQHHDRALHQEIDHVSVFKDIVGSSKMLRRVLEQVAKVARTDSTVLLIGETGTGKGRVALAIHKQSHRSACPFIHVNCAGIPRSELPTELFGSEKNDHTDGKQRIGRFKLAEGGTIFLDEIGELSAEAQATVLHVLQGQEHDTEEQSGSMNVRVLASTSRDLQVAADAGTFRRDLFYRLNVFPIHLPALRERREDIPLLVKHLTDLYARRNGKQIARIDDATMGMLKSYDWPGNVRELQNLIERAVILCDNQTLVIDEGWLHHKLPRPLESPAAPAMTLEDREREAINSALAACRGRVSGPNGAAVKLGIPRSTLESKIKSFGIKKHWFKAE